MGDKKKITLLKNYLGKSPIWFDLRKKEIIKDRIDLEQWEINMKCLIHKYGSFNPSERKAFEEWRNRECEMVDDFDLDEYFEQKSTYSLLNISDYNVLLKLSRREDRNWFLAAYPDVFEYFYPQYDFSLGDLDKETERIETHLKKTKEIEERMLK